MGVINYPCLRYLFLAPKFACVSLNMHTEFIVFLRRLYYRFKWISAMHLPTPYWIASRALGYFIDEVTMQDIDKMEYLHNHNSRQNGRNRPYNSSDMRCFEKFKCIHWKKSQRLWGIYYVYAFFKNISSLIARSFFGVILVEKWCTILPLIWAICRPILILREP